MARSLSTTFVNAMTKQTTNVLLLCLLRVTHGTTSINLVNNTEFVQTDPNLVGVGRTERWNPFPFSISLPSDGNEQIPTLDVQVINVDQEVSKFARTVSGSEETAKASMYLVIYPDASIDKRIRNANEVLLKFEDYDIQNVQYNIQNVSFEMRLHQTLERAFVKETFRPGAFPNLFG